MFVSVLGVVDQSFSTDEIYEFLYLYLACAYISSMLFQPFFAQISLHFSSRYGSRTRDIKDHKMIHLFYILSVGIALYFTPSAAVLIKRAS